MAATQGARIHGQDLITAKALIARSIKQRPFSVVWLFDFWQPCSGGPIKSLEKGRSFQLFLCGQALKALQFPLLFCMYSERLYRSMLLSHANSKSGREEYNVTVRPSALHDTCMYVLYTLVRDASCVWWETFSRLIMRQMIGWGLGRPRQEIRGRRSSV